MTSRNTKSDPSPAMAILAGGLATRLRPMTDRVPKSMILVAGEPFIVHQLRLLRRERITDVIICTGYLGEQIEAFVGDGRRFGCRVRHSSDEDTLLGTGGALRRALPLLGKQFFVMYGDSYLDIALKPVFEAFLAAGLPALMTVYRNADRWDASNVEFTNGTIRRHDKINRTPTMQYIDYGLGAFRASTLVDHPPNTPLDLSQIYHDLADRGKLAGYEIRERFYEIGSPTGLTAMSSRVLQRTQKETE